jgi:2-iminobutanoate/2-iminopropanoate deaminase
MKRRMIFLSGTLSAMAAALKGAATGRSDKRVVSSAEFPKPLGPYSHAVVSGGFVFVAGQAPINAATQKIELGDIRSETRLELTNISQILKASKSSLENVVKVSIHLADLKDFDAMNEVYTEFFRSEYPARTTTQAVLRSGRKIEIDCIARVNS